jgi:glycosyltransferase involved in cell wall biosynthesis
MERDACPQHLACEMHTEDFQPPPLDPPLPLDRAGLLALADELAAQIGQDEDVVDRVELLQRLVGADVCRKLGIYRLPRDFVLSVVIPVYNEAATIEHVVAAVLKALPQCEIVVVDDGSHDETPAVLARLAERFSVDPAAGGEARLRLLRHAQNRGKGAAVCTGLAHATGDAVVIQDADLEYDPQDLPVLLLPLLENEADVVYGSRFAGAARRVTSLGHRWANGLVTLASNLSTGLSLSDVETCYKLFRREQIAAILPELRERGFGIELEITARLARRGARFAERPIRYAPRDYSQGKKIGWRDALRAFWCVLRY